MTVCKVNHALCQRIVHGTAAADYHTAHGAVCCTCDHHFIGRVVHVLFAAKTLGHNSLGDLILNLHYKRMFLHFHAGRIHVILSLFRLDGDGNRVPHQVFPCFPAGGTGQGFVPTARLPRGGRDGSSFDLDGLFHANIPARGTDLHDIGASGNYPTVLPDREAAVGQFKFHCFFFPGSKLHAFKAL